jgi:hypothetical protein
LIYIVFFAVAGVKISICCFLGSISSTSGHCPITTSVLPVCTVPLNKRCVLASTAASCRTSPLLCHSLASFTASKAGSGLLGSPPFQKENLFFAKNVTTIFHGWPYLFVLFEGTFTSF